MPRDGWQTSAVFHELIDQLRSLEDKLFEGPNTPLDYQGVLEGYKWIFSILHVGLDARVWADPAKPRFVDIVGPYKKWGGDNADAFYLYAPIDPQRTYRVSGQRHDSVYLSVTVYGGPNDGRYSERIVSTVNDRMLDFDDEGRFEFIVETAPDAVCAITRDYLINPTTDRRTEFHIECLDPAPEYREDDADLARRFRAALTWVRDQANIVPLALGEPNSVDEPYPVPTTTFGWAAGDAAYAMGSFDLGDDEALVIEGRSPECAFWNLCLWNQFLHTYNYDYERVTINGGQVQYEADGSWRIVVAHRDPGQPNWLSTAGHPRGRLWFRWFHPDATPDRPTTTVIKLDAGPRPAPVEIDDLAAPRFPPEMEPIRAAMADMGGALVLEPDALMAAAVDETGLDDFGDRSFIERLQLICECLTKEAGLSPAGVVAAYTQLSGLLRNRLRVEDFVRRHPEILDLDVARPIIICGLPRTGTTHLHNLLSADPSLRSLPYWESEEPVNRPEDVDRRIERTAAGLDVLNLGMPLFKRMHEMTPEHVHEEIGLIGIDFSGMQFETMAPMPTWRDFYRSQDQRPHYAYLKKVLQVLQWLRGGERWVLKSPQHLEQFAALVDTFPDATFVVTHRDPVSVSASLGTMMSYLARLNIDPVDPRRIAGYWADRLESMLRTCVDTRETLPPDRSIDVRFDEFMADDVAMVKRVYAVAGQPFTAEVRAAMHAFMAENQRGRHGGVVYRFEDLGLDPAELQRALQFYIGRFGVEVEDR